MFAWGQIFLRSAAVNICWHWWSRSSVHCTTLVCYSLRFVTCFHVEDMQCLSLQRICPDAKARQRLLRLYGEGFQIVGLEHATKVPRCEWFLCVLKLDLSVIPQSHLIRSFDVDGCLKVNCIKAPFHVVSPHHFVSPHLSAVPTPVSPT